MLKKIMEQAQEMNAVKLSYQGIKKLSLKVEESNIRGIRNGKDIKIQLNPKEPRFHFNNKECVVMAVEVFTEADAHKFSWSKFVVGSALTSGIGGLIIGNKGKRVKGLTYCAIQTDKGLVQFSTTDPKIVLQLKMIKPQGD